MHKAYGTEDGAPMPSLSLPKKNLLQDAESADFLLEHALREKGEGTFLPPFYLGLCTLSV